MLDRGLGLQRNAQLHFAQFIRQALVHDVVHHPQRRLGNTHGKFFKFNAVKLVHIHLGKLVGKQVEVVFLVKDDFGFQRPQFAIGDDKKITAATGGIQARNACQLILKRQQGL